MNLQIFILLLVFSYTNAFPQVPGSHGCAVKDFPGNITLQAGSLLRLSCPSVCYVSQWQYSRTLNEEREQVWSDFDNPPYFYIQGVASDHTGWYWCITHGGEASVFVDVIDDHAEKEKHDEINTEATTDVVGITEVIDNLEVSIKHIEYTTAVAISEHPTTEEDSLPTSSDLVAMVFKHLQPIHRQLSDIMERLDYVEQKLKIKQ